MSSAATKIRKHTISDDVLNVLANSSTAGHKLFLPTQLDRKLYVETNKVLEALGGEWNRHAKAHLFNSDAAAAVEQAVLTGTYTREKQDFGAFYTPPMLAQQLVNLAYIETGMAILEPNAGEGVLASKARDAGGDVTCVEIRPEACEQLRIRGFKVEQTDFLSVAPTPIYDRVVMNPPFAGRADIYHITHAHKFLKAGGNLVAIASASVAFRDDALARGFRDLVDRHYGTIEALPEGSFRESGTMVNTVIVTMEAARA